MYYIYVERSLLQAAGSHASTKPSRTIGLASIVWSTVKYPHSCGSFGFHSLPPFPRPYTTTYPLCRVTYLVGLRIRKLPCRFRLYLRVEYRPFPLRRLVGLFRCRFDQCNVQACALAACTASVISTNDAAYLPGLSPYVPRRSWKVACSKRLLILSSSENHRRVLELPQH